MSATRCDSSRRFLQLGQQRARSPNSARPFSVTHDPAKANFPAAVEVVQGDLLDVDTVRSALTGVRTLFLLNADNGDRFTEAIIMLNLARDAGVTPLDRVRTTHDAMECVRRGDRQKI